MRKSPEIGSGHHTTYFRELDGRIGRWWSTDPVIHAGMSPYSAFDGNPIYYVDPLGADSGCPDCSKEEIEHREANGQVWDEEYGGWTERAAIKKGKAGKHAKKRAAFIKYMRSIGYTQADVNTYLKLKKRGNNPIVNNIETRIAEGRYEPIYDPNSPYADKWRASWNSGIYSSDYGRGVSSVVGTMGTIAVVAGPGLAIAASGMSANVAREIADEVVDQAWEASTGTPSPFITGVTDLAQISAKRGVKKLSFFSIQNKEDVARLVSGGNPWPISPTRAHIGSGIYTWGDEATAIGYRTKLKGLEMFEGVDLHLLRFDISLQDYNSMTKFDLPLDDNLATKWLSRHSSLWTDNPISHGFQHVTTGRGHGREYYFSSSVFNKLKMTKID